MNNDLRDYVYLDGVYFKEEQILRMATNAGSYSVAEHYLCAYLTYAMANDREDAIDLINKVRETYGQEPYPYTEAKTKTANKLSNKACKAAKMYSEMSPEAQMALLKTCLELLMEAYGQLFDSRNCWNGIYLVIKGRLNGGLSKKDFTELAKRITPKNWPKDKLIANATMSNFSHYVDFEDRYEAYYDMEHNPWEELCEAYWSIIEHQILTSDLRING